MNSILGGVLLLVLAGACFAFGLMGVMGSSGGPITPPESWLAYAAALVLAVFGIVELLYGIARLVRRV